MKTSVSVQWKGTNVCLDLHCSCGVHGHLDAWFAYFLRCDACGRTFEMPHTFELAEVQGWDESPSTQLVFPGGPSHPAADGPDVVTVDDLDTPE